MPRILHLELSPEQTTELEAVRDHDPRPYRREKAAALLKIAAGKITAQVAAHGLLKPRDTDTLYRWVHRYEREGVNGLVVQPGRGRKPAFSPRARRRRTG